MEELDLPEGTLVVLVRRDGAVTVPGGSARLEEGDRITLLVEADVVDEVRRRLT